MSRILIVEDDPQFRLMLEQMLIQDRHQVNTAVNGDDGLKNYQKNPPDLVITDILMPDKDGIEMIIELHKINPQARIIAISGGRRSVSTEFNLSSAELLGVRAALPKPFSRADLRAAIQKALT